MVLEGIHSHDPQARDIAVQYYHAAETAIYDYIARRHPQSAQCVTDFMSTVMSGLSAKAREGTPSNNSVQQLHWRGSENHLEGVMRASTPKGGNAPADKL